MENKEVIELQIIELHKEIIQEVWESALDMTSTLYLTRLGGGNITPEEIKELDGGKWGMLFETLGKLPRELDTSSEGNLKKQFQELGLHPEEIENMKLSLWEYYEDHDLSVNEFSDDGMDEAEQEKDVIPFLIDHILDVGYTVTHPTFLGYAYVKADLLNEGHPSLWVDKDKKSLLVKLCKDASSGKWNNPFYSEALSLWLEDCV